MQLNNGSNAYKLEHIIERADAAKSYHHKNRRYSLRSPGKAITLLVIIAVFIVACFICSRYVEIYGQNELIQKNDKKIAEIEARNTQLTLAIEKQIDIKSIEKYAEDVLGMSKPDRSQVVYITATGNDVMEKTAKPGDSKAKSGSFGAVPDAFSGQRNN